MEFVSNLNLLLNWYPFITAYFFSSSLLPLCSLNWYIVDESLTMWVFGRNATEKKFVRHGIQWGIFI